MKHRKELPWLFLIVFAYFFMSPALAGLSLTVPIYDEATWVEGCLVQINGVVVPDPPDSTSVTRISWDWGDGIVYNHWFPAVHDYRLPGTYTVTVSPFDTEGNSVSSAFEVTLDECTPREGEDFAFLFGWGVFGAGPGEFDLPYGIEFDSEGNVFVTERGNNRVQKFDAEGNYILEWGEEGSGPGQFVLPIDIAIDSAGQLYITDEGNRRVQKFDGTGTYLGEWGSPGSGPGELAQPRGIAVNSAGESDYIYVTDSATHRVEVFLPSGDFVSEFGSFGAGAYEFDEPRGIYVDLFGSVFVADMKNHRVQKFAASGPAGWKEWGSEGSGESQFFNTFSIVTDRVGNVLVGDTGNPWIQRFDNDGVYRGRLGGYGVGPGVLDTEQPGIAVSPTGLIYVVDIWNSRIQVFGSAIVQTVESETGGTLQTADEQLQLTIPLSALSEDTTISILQTTVEDSAAELQIGLSGGQGEVLMSYNLEPTGLTFEQPVELVMTIDVSHLNQGQRSKLDIYLLTDTNGDGVVDTYVSQNAECVVSEGPVFLATCTAWILHFSEYALISPMEEDEDGDFLGTDQDLCPGTVIPELVPTLYLGANRWALLDEDLAFDTNPAANVPIAGFTVADTLGCSCEQIIEVLGLGKGHAKFGCSTSVMAEWIALH